MKNEYFWNALYMCFGILGCYISYRVNGAISIPDLVVMFLGVIVGQVSAYYFWEK